MITREDLIKHKMFYSVVKEADYKIKGDAINLVASLLKWYEDLGKKMECEMGKNEMTTKKPSMKKLKEVTNGDNAGK